MGLPAPAKGGATFPVRCSVEQMDAHRSSTIDPDGAESAALQELLKGERARMLKGQLASWNPRANPEEIEDAVQTACKRFLEHAQDISNPGQVYSWLRTTASRILSREAERRHREIAFNPTTHGGVWTIPDDDAGPVEALVELEDDADLEMLVREVSTSLPDRGRQVFALYGAGLNRPQIADRLSIGERAVKKSLEEIMEQARTAVARLAGGGCSRGEPLVLRSACGLATSTEEAQAHDHLAQCHRCEVFLEKLLAWRDKAGAVLPAPVAAEGTNPGMLERVAQKVSEGIGSAKQRIFDGGAQLKQQATSASARAVDPTPLAAARPGTAVAVIASCIAIGTGAAGYCVQQGVDPLGAARGLIASAPEEEPEAAAPPPAAEPTVPTYTPEPPVEEEPAPTPEPSPQTTPESQPDPEPKEPENSFEPASSTSPSSETGSEASYEATEESAPAPEPAPASPSNGSQQFQP